MDRSKLVGIFTALLTPFDGNNKINEEVLRQHVEGCLEGGVEGFYVAGSTGEAFLLSSAERKTLLEMVVDQVAGRAPVIAHIGSIATAEAVELGRHAVAAGAKAVSAIPPFYYKFTAEEIVDHYSEIAEAVDLPLIPYNFPSLSGVVLTSEMIDTLRRRANIIGVKFTSNDLYSLERMKHSAPELIIYNGLDELFLSGTAAGADGAIGSTYNFMPDKFIQIRAALREGKFTEAQAIQHEANQVIEALLQTGKLLSAQKYLLSLAGLDFGGCRKPFRTLTQADEENLSAVFNQYVRESILTEENNR